MKFVKRKVTTSKSKLRADDFLAVKREFLDDVSAVVTMEEIPAHLILNWDQTGIQLVPAASWTMERVGSKRVEVKGIKNKQQITAVLCGSMIGDYLPIQLIYKGSTSRCHPNSVNFPRDWHITHSPKHWSTESTMVEYVIVPYIDGIHSLLGNPSQAALVIIDNFKAQIIPAVNKMLEDANIHVCLLPPNTTDVLQPLDIAVIKPVKDFLRRKFELWYADQVAKQLEGVTDIQSANIQPVDISFVAMKALSGKWLIEMSEYLADSPEFMINEFRRAGILDALDGNNACRTTTITMKTITMKTITMKIITMKTMMKMITMKI